MTLHTRRILGAGQAQHNYRVRVLQEAEKAGLLTFQRSFHGNSGAWFYLVIGGGRGGRTRSLAASEVVPYAVGLADAKGLVLPTLEYDEESVISGEVVATADWLDENACKECRQHPGHKMDCSRRERG